MKKCLSIILSVLLLHLFSYAPLATETPTEKARQAMLAMQVRAAVRELGEGTFSRVRVVLYDKTEYQGYITEITADHFVIADAETGMTAPIAYREVKGIKGNNFSTGAKIGIGVAIAAGIGIVIAILAARNNEEDAPPTQCTGTAQVGAPCPPGCICIQ
ncbi:MAG TPA: hypothetical protein VF723_14125 [Pyrinomonadaceae bacterium]|jgi:hypothetical protein